MPGPWPAREAQRAATRERLISCATAVARSEGLAELTVDRVAGAADVNRTTFYLHFTGRNELSLAVGLEFLGTAGEHLAAWDAMRRPTRASAARWVRSTVEGMHRDMKLLEVLEHALVTMPDAAPTLYAAMDSVVACMPRTLARVGEVRRPRLHAAAWQLVRTAALLSMQKGLLDREAALDLLAQQWFEETTAHPV